jgi:ribosomal protein L12E/L44/L45/RPP1/RPP2
VAVAASRTWPESRQALRSSAIAQALGRSLDEVVKVSAVAMLAARCAGPWDSATDHEQAHGEDKDDELESDAYEALEAALQALVADGEPQCERE